MRPLNLCLPAAVGTLTLLVLSAGPARADDLEKDFRPIFNGRDLTGWEGKPGWWHVEDGALTCQSTPQKPCTKCNYLMWRGGKPGDFELRAAFKLVGGNSGIQFRSRELPDFDTSGYQADIDADGQWIGALFEHERGKVAGRGEKVGIDEKGKRTVKPLAHAKDILKHIKQGDWNEYRVIAKGHEITLMLNGVVTAQVTDNQKGKAALDGVIALQMHPGPPMKIQFKNIRIKELK